MSKKEQLSEQLWPPPSLQHAQSLFWLCHNRLVVWPDSSWMRDNQLDTKTNCVTIGNEVTLYEWTWKMYALKENCLKQHNSENACFFLWVPSSHMAKLMCRRSQHKCSYSETHFLLLSMVSLNSDPLKRYHRIFPCFPLDLTKWSTKY
jgi:hypothetical protein